MILPFPADSAEFEEFLAVTGEIAREIFESTPDPEPPDDSHLDGDWTQYDDEPEDSYLDSMYEDQYEISEYGMEGCCGDF